MAAADVNRVVRRRRSLRQCRRDYTAPDIYLVTVCSYQRAAVFGTKIDRGVRLTSAGLIVQDCWNAIPNHFSGVSIDESVIMPDHVHGIVVIGEQVGARHASPLPATTSTLQPGSLGAIVGAFKSAVTKRINELRGTPGARVWQRNYYDQAVGDLEAAREYIRRNPEMYP